MEIVYVNLPTAKEVQNFVHVLKSLDGDFEFISDTCILDARSLLGIFSLDISKLLQLKVYNNSPKNMDALRSFIIDSKEIENE